MTDILTKYNETPLYDLQEVIQQYQTQPELLKLILSSKVEEDKRRAEEAKLRAKELDLHSQNCSNQKILPSLNDYNKQFRSAPYSIPKSRNYRQSFEEEEEVFNQRRHSAAAAMLAMGGSLIEDQPPVEKSQEDDLIVNAYPSPTPEEQYHSDDSSRPTKRKREMQAITKIVETRDFPYIDNYFWKNNGNTIQKKTGCKSIYYKCSNSNKGCSVNKTVTARPNGEYLIKYRGCHLLECGRVERIRDL